MEAGQSDGLRNINKTLEMQNEILKQMLGVMPKESGKFTRVLETVVLFVGLFGVIALIDIVRNWFFGG